MLRCAAASRLVPNRSALLNLLTVRALCNKAAGSSQRFPLPWPSQTAGFTRDSFFNKIAGYTMLNRHLSNGGQQKITFSELLDGAEECVHHMANVLSNTSMHSDLELLLHPNLYSAVQTALEAEPEPREMSIRMLSLYDMRLLALNTTFGHAEPDDRHVISFLGQKLITSQKQMDAAFSSHDPSNKLKFTLDDAKMIGFEASMKKVDITFTVSFRCKEKIEMGTLDEIRTAYHVWKFWSAFKPNNKDYPLQWIICDINNFLAKQDV